MEIMEKAINLSVKLGVRCIQLAAYDVYYEESDDETKQLFEEGLRGAVAMAARAGVILALEIMDTKFVVQLSVPCTICMKFPRRILKSIQIWEI